MGKEELQAIALNVIKVHNLEKVFLTSDGQAFTENQRAEDHARILDDKNITLFERKDVEKPTANLELAKSEEAINYEEQKTLLKDREFLFARHEALTGNEPQHNIGIDKLADKVQEIEKEKFKTQNEE